MEHTTVCVNKYTLQFEDANLEASFQAFSHTRKKTLWLRSLIPAAISHLVFAWGDSLEHDPSRLQVTLPARLLLIVMQCSTYFLVKWDLVKADEQLMFALALCHGIPTLLLFTLQHAMLHQWDALFVVFGLSFYTIPKVTPLGFVYSTMGSTITMVVYFAIALFCRPPPDKVSRTLHPSSAWTSTSRHPPDVSGTTLFLGVLLWGVFTLGSFASVPDTFKFVDEET
ncbi:hypothetical protein DYB35_009445, partial [Aphanomyces astaci]